MHKLSCPKCHQKLVLQGNSYLCENNHCYDISKSKYVNLLLNPDKATNNPGDSKESLVSRRNFLTKGYYDAIANTVIDVITQYQNKDSVQILDVGCGEGYYTNKIRESLNNIESSYYGLDISKEAIHMATKYTKDIYWIVGNSKNLPVEDHSMDFILALFTVVNQEELKRTLQKNGYIIHVTANPKHLIEIKELIYDEVKIKSDKHIRLPFTIVDSFDFIKQVTIDNHADALDLLKMTPHYYHIKKEKRSIIQTIENITITIDIKITVYQTS
jgi:23S rRNA (guanine745-N1)-methyltransferase